MSVPLLESRGLRLVALCTAAWAGGSCGGGSDSIGPPGPPTVASIEIVPSTLSMAVGETAQLAATVRAEDGSVLTDRSITWATSDAAIAGVDGSGTVTGMGGGQATLTATCEGKTGQATVKVSTTPVASVEVSPNPAAVAVAQTAQLAVALRAEDGSELSGRQVDWSTSDPAIATVNGTGQVTGVAVGQATITAASEGKSGSTELSVSAVPVASVEVTPSEAEIAVGAAVQLTATAKDAGDAVLPDRPAAWTSSDPAVAQVNATGRVTGVVAGTAAITATIEGKTASASISVVQQAVATVEVSPNPASVAVQQNLQLTVTLKAADGTELTGRTVEWETSNQAIATVNQSGRVTGVTAGSATITARSEGKSGNTALTVTQTQAPVETVEISPNSLIRVPVGGTQQYTATLKAADGTVLTGRAISWSSSNQTVATINASGLATGRAPGNVIITATSEGKSGTTELNVAPPSGIVRTWRGGAAGGPRNWSIAANWNPAGKPIALDTVRIPANTNPAVLSEDVQVARVLLVGGQLGLAGHRLRIIVPREN
jgi:uncharacterized protein YjdB